MLDRFKVVDLLHESIVAALLFFICDSIQQSDAIVENNSNNIEQSTKTHVVSLYAFEVQCILN